MGALETERVGDAGRNGRCDGCVMNRARKPHGLSWRLAGAVHRTASRAKRGPDPPQRDTLQFSVLL